MIVVGPYLFLLPYYSENERTPVKKIYKQNIQNEHKTNAKQIKNE